VYDVDKAFTVTLSHPSGNSRLTGPSAATVTVVNTDAAPTVAFTSEVYTASDNAGTAAISLTLSRPSGQPVTVTYMTHGDGDDNDDDDCHCGGGDPLDAILSGIDTGGQPTNDPAAVAGQNYVDTRGTATFAPYQMTATF